MSLVTDEIRAAASEIYAGDAICQEKSKFLLTEVNLPNGLLPLKDIEECGYVKDTGFVWLKQKKKCEHKFAKIPGKPVQYGAEVTAVVEPNRIRKLTGVKAKELFMWLTISEIYVDDPPTGKIHFKTTSGISRSFPVDAFQIELEEEKAPEKEEEKAVVENENENEKEKEKEKEEEVKGKMSAAAVAPAPAAVEVKEV